MNQIVTTGIVLGRIDYGEADRILTFLTPDQGKVRLMAKGVRRIKSKLAGGIELFSVSHITFIRGRAEIGTLISTRLDKHYGHIVANLDRTMLGYELIRQLHKRTEDQSDAEYFEILHQVFEALDDVTVPLPIIQLWFLAQILRFGGHMPNLQTNDQGQALKSSDTYDFNFETMAFNSSGQGRFTPDQIKFLRLVFAGHAPGALANVQGGAELARNLVPLVEQLSYRNP